MVRSSYSVAIELLHFAREAFAAVMTFEEIMTRWAWKPIPRCPGRWVLSMADFHGGPEALAGPSAEVVVFEAGRTADPVVVVWLDQGGLISYKKGEGKYLHTLNTAEGLERKLSQLGIFGFNLA